MGYVLSHHCVTFNHSHRNYVLVRTVKLQIRKSTSHLGVLSFGAQMWAAGENVKLSYLLLKAPPLTIASRITSMKKFIRPAAVKLRGSPPTPLNQPTTLALRSHIPSLHISFAPKMPPKVEEERRTQHATSTFLPSPTTKHKPL